MRRVLWAGPYWLTAIVVLLCRCVPRFADRWRRGVILPVSALLCRMGGLIPYVLAFAALLVFLRALHLRRYRWVAQVICAFTAAAVSGYGLLWLPLYYAPQARPYVIDQRADAVALEQLARGLIAELASKTASPPADIPLAAQRALAALPELSLRDRARPRAARWPHWMAWLRLSGVYLPWFGEALYSPAQPANAQLFTACHELAHLAGIADEGQANIVAWRACIKMGGAAARSARLHALACALPRLYREAPAAWMRCAAKIDGQTLDDLRAMGGLTGARAGGRPLLSAFARWMGIGEALEDYGDLVDYLAGKMGEVQGANWHEVLEPKL